MITTSKQITLGVGVAAIATAVGAYYLLGKQGKSNRKSFKTWVVRARKDLVSELSRLTDVTQKTYTQAVAKIIKRYRKFQKDYPEEFALLSKEFQNQWEQIRRRLPKPDADKN